LSEGKGSKRAKHRPSLEKCQKHSNILGFVEQWWFWGIGMMVSIYEGILRIWEGIRALGYKLFWLFNHGVDETKKNALKTLRKGNEGNGHGKRLREVYGV